jgi:hypothetical protein
MNVPKNGGHQAHLYAANKPNSLSSIGYLNE